jgi:hypothetical protein
MRLMLSGFAAICLAATVACTANLTEPSALPLGQPFELRAGATVNVRGSLAMRFESVAADSRCPMDALCVSAGDATLILRVSQGSNPPATAELHTQPAGSEVVYSNFTIKLVSLGPYPRSNLQIRPEDYVATITVSAK